MMTSQVLDRTISYTTDRSKQEDQNNGIYFGTIIPVKASAKSVPQIQIQQSYNRIKWPVVTYTLRATVDFAVHVVQHVRIDTGKLTMQTPTEQAKIAFLQEVLRIKGVSVRLHGRGSLAEQTIHNIVPDILGSVADQVYALEVRIRRQYRHVKLSLEVEQGNAHNEMSLISIRND